MLRDQLTLTTRLPAQALLVRTAQPDDYDEIRAVVRAAHLRYSGLMAPPQVFERHLGDLLDLDRHAREGVPLVVEAEGRIQASAVFYPDAYGRGLGLPGGWAGGRGLAVHPGVRGSDVASTLLAECERLARFVGAPVFAFHTAGFMTRVRALYERLGYRRAPEFDYDLAGRHELSMPARTVAIAYRRDLTARYAA
jgi:GNAT superfamily N-acetyltransferase